MDPVTPPTPPKPDDDPHALESDPEVIAAFAEHERAQGSKRLVVGCWLVIALLPAGFIVDLLLSLGNQQDQQTHQAELWLFAGMRVVGSVLIVPLLVLFRSGRGVRHYQTLGILLAVIPGLVMCGILNVTGSPWPYYAGINLVLLAMALVAQWTWRQSALACLLLLAAYLAATWNELWLHFRNNFGIAFSNVWFMGLTGIIMVVGSELQFRLRFRSFASAEALRRSRQALASSLERLQELDELKGRFFANISHELRTPLTLLLAPLERVLQEAARGDSPWRETLEGMRGNGMRLLKLINDLLDLVRLDAGHLKLSCVSVDLPTFLNGLVAAIRSLAEERGLKVACEVDPALRTLHADPDKLEKVFLNLLFNAIKFTAAGGQVRLAARREGDAAVFDVTDSGVGIAPEDLPFLFSRFWQADSSSRRKAQGVGIGLALVKELVLAHGGAVSATSEVGRGTTITVRLPLAGSAPVPAGVPETAAAPATAPETKPLTPQQPREEPESDADWLQEMYRRAERFGSVTPLRVSARPLPMTSRGDRPRALVVDDEPDMLRFLSMQLSPDYEVVEALDGDQAVTLARQCLPDVIICDFMMPEKDGITVCRELRAEPATRALPLLMLTARADDDTKVRALSAGANDFLPKPFSLAELSARVRSLSDGHQLQLALARQNQRLEATIEELRDTELQLVQAEKMASLGRMAAGIIHEINNPLNYALTALDLLNLKKDCLPEGERPEYAETIQDVDEGLRRVAGIISDLRIFTHPQGGEIEDVSARDAADAALRFLAAELKSQVEVENELPESLTVRAVRTKLIQVFLNLFQNSLDALRSRADGDRTPRISLSAEPISGGTKIRIRDNGPGIPQELLPRIFDPFFTTKEVGQGTGLGLSICFRLLNEVGATISVDSQFGEFCEFTLAFPEREPQAEAEFEAVGESNT